MYKRDNNEIDKRYYGEMLILAARYGDETIVNNILYAEKEISPKAIDEALKQVCRIGFFDQRFIKVLDILLANKANINCGIDEADNTNTLEVLLKKGADRMKIFKVAADWGAEMFIEILASEEEKKELYRYMNS